MQWGAMVQWCKWIEAKEAPGGGERGKRGQLSKHTQAKVGLMVWFDLSRGKIGRETETVTKTER